MVPGSQESSMIFNYLIRTGQTQVWILTKRTEKLPLKRFLLYEEFRNSLTIFVALHGMLFAHGSGKIHRRHERRIKRHRLELKNALFPEFYIHYLESVFIWSEGRGSRLGPLGLAAVVSR